MKRSPIGNTGVGLPPVVFGTSALGNLYTALSDDTKLEIVSQCFEYVPKPVVFDSAGKYGAGLALEMLGKCLSKLGIKEDEVIISNKLGWLRKELTTPEPTFEPGVWRNLKYDAYMDISSEGILKCFEQGNELLGGKYKPQLLSIHDPDEYILLGQTQAERDKRIRDILDGYKTLMQLKKEGKAKAIGIGAKDWRAIQMLASQIEFDWVMFANSLTIMQQPAELLKFMEELRGKGVSIINSAVFHSGFLTGGSFFDYKPVSATDPVDAKRLAWREKFFQLCEKHNLTPAVACVNFAMKAPGVAAISLNTSNPEHVKLNVASVTARVNPGFYQEMISLGLLDASYPYLSENKQLRI
jgi:D-threo-aldose 1-dehydrogenase